MTPLWDPLLPMAVECTERWVLHERNRHRSGGEVLDASQRELLAPWFLPDTLETVRVVRTRLRNPALSPHALLPKRFSGALLDLRKIGGITYDDTVVINERAHPGVTPIGLLFHEMVHVAQYRLLGVRGFAEGYVRGWLEAGLDYRKIPLEVEAYSLQAEFAAGTVGGTAVEHRLADRLGVSLDTFEARTS